MEPTKTKNNVVDGLLNFEDNFEDNSEIKKSSSRIERERAATEGSSTKLNETDNVAQRSLASVALPDLLDQDLNLQADTLEHADQSVKNISDRVVRASSEVLPQEVREKERESRFLIQEEEVDDPLHPHNVEGAPPHNVEEAPPRPLFATQGEIQAKLDGKPPSLSVQQALNDQILDLKNGPLKCSDFKISGHLEKNANKSYKLEEETLADGKTKVWKIICSYTIKATQGNGTPVELILTTPLYVGMTNALQKDSQEALRIFMEAKDVFSSEALICSGEAHEVVKNADGSTTPKLLSDQEKTDRLGAKSLSLVFEKTRDNLGSLRSKSFQWITGNTAANDKYATEAFNFSDRLKILGKENKRYFVTPENDIISEEKAKAKGLYSEDLAIRNKGFSITKSQKIERSTNNPPSINELANDPAKLTTHIFTMQEDTSRLLTNFQQLEAKFKNRPLIPFFNKDAPEFKQAKKNDLYIRMARADIAAGKPINPKAKEAKGLPENVKEYVANLEKKHAVDAHLKVLKDSIADLSGDSPVLASILEKPEKDRLDLEQELFGKFIKALNDPSLDIKNLNLTDDDFIEILTKRQDELKQESAQLKGLIETAEKSLPTLKFYENDKNQLADMQGQLQRRYQHLSSLKEQVAQGEDAVQANVKTLENLLKPVKEAIDSNQKNLDNLNKVFTGSSNNPLDVSQAPPVRVGNVPPLEPLEPIELQPKNNDDVILHMPDL